MNAHSTIIAPAMTLGDLQHAMQQHRVLRFYRAADDSFYTVAIEGNIFGTGATLAEAFANAKSYVEMAA